jgi:hypothetical protein
MSSLEPHIVAHIATQNAQLDRMCDTLDRLETMAGNLESELEHQGLEIERLDAEARAQERDASGLFVRHSAPERSQTAELWCWVLMIATAVLAFVFYSLMHRRGMPDL